MFLLRVFYDFYQSCIKRARFLANISCNLYPLRVLSKFKKILLASFFSDY